MSTEIEETNNGNERETATSPRSRSEMSSITEEPRIDRNHNLRMLVNCIPLTSAFSLSPDKLEDYVKQTIIDYVIPHVKFTDEKVLDPKGSVARVIRRKVPNYYNIPISGNHWLQTWNNIQKILKSSLRKYKSVTTQKVGKSLLGKKKPVDLAFEPSTHIYCLHYHTHTEHENESDKSDTSDESEDDNGTFNAQMMQSMIHLTLCF